MYIFIYIYIERETDAHAYIYIYIIHGMQLLTLSYVKGYTDGLTSRRVTYVVQIYNIDTYVDTYMIYVST